MDLRKLVHIDRLYVKFGTRVLPVTSQDLYLAATGSEGILLLLLHPGDVSVSALPLTVIATMFLGSCYKALYRNYRYPTSRILRDFAVVRLCRRVLPAPPPPTM